MIYILTGKKNNINPKKCRELIYLYEDLQVDCLDLSDIGSARL